MNNTMVMEQHFERNKNLQATVITAFVCTVVFLVFFYIRWQLPVIEKPLLSEGIEVNIGYSDQGSGDVQPLVQGDPAPTSNPDNNTTPPSGSGTPATSTDNSDAKDPDAIATSSTKTNTKPVNNPNPTPVKSKPTPAPPSPKPKATFDKKYSGGNGNGGNNKDGYNDSRSEGNDKTGTGDKGKPWGTVDGKAYDGPGGVRIKNGLNGRRPTKLPSFEDDFTEDAKVAVDITVDESGKVTSAVVNPSGTSTANKNTRNVAVKRALQIKFNPGKETQTGTIILDMRVRG